MFLLRLVWAVVHALFAKKADLVAENRISSGVWIPGHHLDR